MFFKLHTWGYMNASAPVCGGQKYWIPKLQLTSEPPNMDYWERKLGPLWQQCTFLTAEALLQPLLPCLILNHLSLPLLTGRYRQHLNHYGTLLDFSVWSKMWPQAGLTEGFLELSICFYHLFLPRISLVISTIHPRLTLSPYVHTAFQVSVIFSGARRIVSSIWQLQW